MQDFITMNFFYPMLFITLGVVLTVLITSTKAVLIKFKDKDSQNFMFKTHCDEHIDTTEKMKDMHKEVVQVKFCPEHEREFDALEKSVKELQDNVSDLNKQIDILFERIVQLEKKR